MITPSWQEAVAFHQTLKEDIKGLDRTRDSALREKMVEQYFKLTVVLVQASLMYSASDARKDPEPKIRPRDIK